MAIFKFESPNHKGSPFNPRSLQNGFLRIPDKPGVYIWGYLIEIDGKLRFCPINVGETNDLRKRLFSDHYLGNMPVQSKNRKGEKEIFEFKKVMSSDEVHRNYKVMSEYNKPKGCKENKDCDCFFCNEEKHQGKLLFYQGFADLNKMHGKKFEHDQCDIKFYDFYNYLYLNTRVSPDPLISRIDDFYTLHMDRFFCVFLQDGKNRYLSVSPSNRTTLESEVKQILSQELGIETTAKAKKLKQSAVQIDLTCIKDLLIRLKKGRKKYVNQAMNFHSKDELILPR
jgi:hypothetical protein